MTPALRAPFPWFGGKSRAAQLVWAAFGDVPNYVEPFAGSLAVLLGRPTEPRIETVNDIDCYLANAWRSIQAAPAEVARWADWPVNEADLHARHRWLVNRETFRKRMKADPHFFHTKIAGWWLWGLCQWIGSGWCAAPEWWQKWNEGDRLGDGRRPDLKGNGVTGKAPVEWTGRTNAGRRARGIHTADHEQRPDLTASRGVLTIENEKRPYLWRGGLGVHRHSEIENTRPQLGPERGVQRRVRDLSNSAEWEKRPVLSHRGGRGVHRQLKQQVPDLSGDSGAAGRGVHASGLDKMPKMDRGTESRLQGGIYDWMDALSGRLRRVRVCCGDWTRILGPSSTEKIGLTGVFLDPPYSSESGRDPRLYAHDDEQVAHQVREWALANGDNPKLRIALCGYEGEHAMPETWQCVAWKANGGYASSAGNHENAHRERIWFSPACLPVHPRQATLFQEVPTLASG